MSEELTLTFDDALAGRHFEFLFVGFILGGSLQEKKGLHLLRTELALFDKLEAISELRPCGKTLVNGEPDRRLKTTGQGDGGGRLQLPLTAQEIDLLTTYISQVPWQTGSPGKHALETLDWLAQQQNGGR